MTDKVQKIRAFLVGIADADGVSTILAKAIEKKILPYIDSLQEEPVSVWHNASEEPNDMGHCLIFYGCKESVGHYLHYEPVLYNKKEKMFVTSSFPHPTGYKVEQKSFDGGCVAEVYKNRRDRISISDITQWCYLCDLHNLSNVERIGKEWKEEPVSEDLEEASRNYADNEEYGDDVYFAIKAAFKAGAKWQKEQDQSTIELAEDHAMLAGMNKIEQQMMENAIDATIGLPYENKDGGYTHLIDVSRPLPVGNNKIAIIFKED